ALFQPILSISPAQFSWIGDVKFNLKHVDSETNSPQSPNIAALVTTNVDQGLKKISKLETQARLERKRAFRHVARASTRTFQNDKVETTQAVPAAPAPALSEQERLQSVHLALIS